MPTHLTHVVIVGGGIAGLATAWSAHRHAMVAGVPIRCTVIEADVRWGGKIWTRMVDDTIVEAGPDSFLSQKPWALELCRELGLETELISTTPSTEKAFVYSRGRLRPLPEGLVVLTPGQFAPFIRSGILDWSGLARLALDFILPRHRHPEDESVAGFFRRRVGRQAFERFIEPLLAGIYAGDAEQMSLAATFPRFLELEQRHGSVIRGMLHAARGRSRERASGPSRSMFVTLRGGLGTLIEALVSRLQSAGVVLLGDRRVVSLEKEGGRARYALRLDDDTELRADAIVLATPGYVTGDLLARVDRGAASLIAGIPYASTATVSLAYDARDLPAMVRGYGFVVPRAEQRDLLAATWTSRKWPHRGSATGLVARCYVGGLGRDAIVKLDDDELVRRVRHELSSLAGLSQPPRWTLVTRWERAMPQYHVGHLERLDRIQASLRPHRGLYVTGAAYRGIGIPDCVRDGMDTGRRLVQDCETTLPLPGSVPL